MNLKDLYIDTEYEDVNGIEILNIFPNVKGVQFTDKIFDEFIQNFEELKEEKRPHLKIDHTAQQAVLKSITGKDFEPGTELPNLGFIDRMYHNGTSLFADITQVPSKLKSIIFDKKLFSAVSPEATFNYRGMGKKVVTALALTNNPAQKHILNVHMDERTTEVAARGSEAGPICFSGDILINDIGGVSMSDTTETKKTITDVTKSSEDDVVKLSEKIAEKLSGFFSKKEDSKSAQQDVQNTPATVALSEYNAMKNKFDLLLSEMNGLKLSLIEKDKAQKLFSEQLGEIKKQTRAEKAEAICQQAILDGVHPVVVNYMKPLLFSEIGEQTIHLSEVVDGKTIEADRPLTDFIKGLFKIYPNKLDFSDRMSTKVDEPGIDESLEMSEINKLAEGYVAKGMPFADAFEKAGIEFYGKKRGK